MSNNACLPTSRSDASRPTAFVSDLISVPKRVILFSTQRKNTKSNVRRDRNVWPPGRRAARVSLTELGIRDYPSLCEQCVDRPLLAQSRRLAVFRSGSEQPRRTVVFFRTSAATISTIVSGVRSGAISPFQVSDQKPGYPLSATVGTSGELQNDNARTLCPPLE
jgi:hypothetical protein